MASKKLNPRVSTNFTPRFFLLDNSEQGDEV